MILRSSLELIFCFIMLCSLEAYLFLNIANPDKGSIGLYFLLFYCIGGLFFIFYTMLRSYKIYLHKSIFLIFLWFCYYIFKIITDMGLGHVHSKVTSTTGGMVMFYIVGVISAILVLNIYNHIKKGKERLFNILFLLFFLFFSVCVVAVFIKFFDLMQQSSSIRYYIPEYARLYQRPGNFITIAFSIFSVLCLIAYLLNNSKNSYFNKWINYGMFLLYTVMTLLGVLAIQILGSNKVVFLLLGQFLLLLYIVYIRSFILRFKRINQIFKDPYFFQALIKVGIFLIISFFILVFVAIITDIEVRYFRVFNIFNGESGGSISSRFELYYLFFEQFSQSMTMGVMNVKELIGNKNTHSFILELLVNTGLIGFFIFVVYFSFSLKESFFKEYSLNNEMIIVDLYKVGFLLACFSIACVAIGINWIVLWFLLGFTFVPFRIAVQEKINN